MASEPSAALPIPTDQDGSSSAQALRTRKRNRERARATRACDRCKKRKIKCNGTQPCEVCVRAKASCKYESAYTRGQAPLIRRVSFLEGGIDPIANKDQDSSSPGSRISATTVERQSLPAPELEHSSSVPTTEAVLQPGWNQEHVFPPGSETQPTISRDLAVSSQSSPEPCGDDSQGQYIGPTSGVSFLLRVQKRLHQSISVSHASNIFTFGDAPLQLPEFDPSFCMMLPRDDAQRLVDRYFDFAMPTYRFLHRATIQEWFNEFYDTLGVMRDAVSAPAKIALLFMVLAQGRVYMPDGDVPGPPDLSTRYFLAAEHQLTKERGLTRLTSVQARLTQCYYLLTQSRINHCWSLFGTVSHLVLAIGLNRNKRPDSTSESSTIEIECRRRTFWCAYTLDTFLSVALGRPRSLHDDDIDTELPACLDDDELTMACTGVTSPRVGPSIMFAPLAHIKLARILGKIVRDLYSIKPISASRRAMLTDRISKDLSDWWVEMARFLDVDHFSTSLQVPIFQRQRNVLNLTYWHAIILTYRPIVLSRFTRSVHQARGASDADDPETEESVQQCLGAAMNTVNTVEDMTLKHQIFRAFWITTYYAFTATTMLYLYVIQKRTLPPEVYNTYFSAASRCQSHLSAIAAKGSLSERYCLVLEELRVEVLRQARRGQHQSAPTAPVLAGLEDPLQQNNNLPPSSVPTDESRSAGAIDFTSSLGGPPIDFNGMPSSAFSDNSGWGQFVSMVSSGMCNFDMFMDGDSLRL